MLDVIKPDGLVPGVGASFAIQLSTRVPIGWPAIASLAIYQFMWVWNDLLVALVFASPSNAPITYSLYSQMRTFSTNIDIIGPGAFVSTTLWLLATAGFAW